MKRLYILKNLLFLSLFTTFLSCGSDDTPTDDYTEISPVVVDLSTVPYPKLSDYKFFKGEMKNMEPAYKVLPYDLNSALFTDYAHKKRFVWMPEGTKATYTTDGEILNFPTGAVLIKNFYYDNVLPDNIRKIIETRIMIKKADGWIFANYVWNNDQTEALLDMNGSTLPISWNENNFTKSITYSIPSGTQCTSCHSLNGNYIPIGPKPQNLYKDFTYSDGIKNQLTKWQEEGYLNTKPNNVTATVNWEDTNQSLELRSRSYLDINCAHCHTPGGDCDDMPMNLAFNATTNPINLGICVVPHDFVNGPQTHIITKQNSSLSLMYFKMKTTTPEEIMPPLGRSVTHIEGLDLIAEWIDTMEEPCP